MSARGTFEGGEKKYFFGSFKKLVMLPASLCEAELLVTEKEISAHGRPPVPREAVRSKGRLSQKPIVDGEEMAMEGKTGEKGGNIAIVDSSRYDHVKQRLTSRAVQAALMREGRSKKEPPMSALLE